MEENIPKATIGRIVLYTYHERDLDTRHQHLAGTSRPAIVVHVWDEEFRDVHGAPVPGYNLQVFTDGNNDRVCTGDDCGTIWKTSVRMTAEPTPGSCHWPPRA